MNQKTVTLKTIRRVRQALARRDVFVEEYCTLNGIITRSETGYTLFLPKIGLNVFLRPLRSKSAMYVAVGTGPAGNSNLAPRGDSEMIPKFLEYALFALSEPLSEEEFLSLALAHGWKQRPNHRKMWERKASPLFETSA